MSSFAHNHSLTNLCNNLQQFATTDDEAMPLKFDHFIKNDRLFQLLEREF